MEPNATTNALRDMLRNTTNGCANTSRFIEVKSPNDRLSEKQEIWLHVLAELGADVAVCNIADWGAKSTR